MQARRATDVRTVRLRAISLDLLQKPVTGKGGFQSLMRRLQQGLDLEGPTLTVTVGDVDTLIGYCQRPRAGGFQRRLWAVVCDVVVDGIRPRLLTVRPADGRGSVAS